MKRIFAFLLLLFAPTFVWADMVSNYDKNIFTKSQDVESILDAQLPIIEERMKHIFSDINEFKHILVKEDIYTQRKLIKYNNLLAEKIFNEYEEFFLWKMKQKSKETGREIKESVGYDTIYWLDAGIMDSEQCNGGTYERNNNSKKEQAKYFEDLQKHTCLYPEGFEEFAIKLIEYDGEHELVVFIDDVLSNIRNVYTIALKVDDNIDNSAIEENTLFFTSFKQTYDYHDYHRYRNEEQSSIINGKIFDEPLPKSKIEDYSFGMDNSYISWKASLK